MPKTIEDSIKNYRKWFKSNAVSRKKTGYCVGSWKKLPRDSSNDKPRVAWVLFGNEEVGSSRLKGILIDAYVNKNKCGFTSTIVYKQPKQDARLKMKQEEWRPFLERTDILVIQTWAGSTLELLRDCQKYRIPVILTLSDLHQIPVETLEMVDAIVVSSERLEHEYSKQHPKVMLIDDPIEVPSNITRRKIHIGSDPELVWIGHWMHWQEVEFIKTILNSPEFDTLGFRTITKHPEASHQWNLRTRWKNLTHSDIAVIPCSLDEWGISKSSNRLATFLTLGYPTIASPIPSYKKLITHGVNGFFAETKEEWEQCIRLLRDPLIRKQIGEAAKATQSLQELSIEKVVKRWEELFIQLISNK